MAICYATIILQESATPVGMNSSIAFAFSDKTTTMAVCGVALTPRIQVDWVMRGGGVDDDDDGLDDGGLDGVDDDGLDDDG